MVIHTRRYQLMPHQGAPDLPAGISLSVPILRKRTLREAALLDLVRAALGL